jgi:pre-rRNA-processing protein TSR1
MLRHENRRSVVHFGLQRVDGEDGGVVKSKDELEMHCGFARFVGRPMFSEQNANSDKHKMERYLVHSRYTVASFYGPAIFAPAPALLFHPGGSLIATGSALGADPDRIVLKRIVLTGYPYKTMKKRTVVKFMFFTPEDIRWFRPVELWTKLGRSGHIVEPLGTHGRMKCMFDAPVLHHDTVCMTLYKRVFPKTVENDSNGE